MVREIITLLQELRDPLGVRARRELAVPPHLRRRRPVRPAAALFMPGHGGRPAGHEAGRAAAAVPPRTREGLRHGPARPPSQLAAALSGSRGPGLLVSVSALPAGYRSAWARKAAFSARGGSLRLAGSRATRLRQRVTRRIPAGSARRADRPRPRSLSPARGVPGYSSPSARYPQDTGRLGPTG